MNKKRLIIILILVLLGISAKLSPLFVMGTTEKFEKLAQNYAHIPNGSVTLPQEPYKLTPTQKSETEKCVQKELSSDPDSEKEIDLEKYCECLSMFDDEKYKALSDSEVSAIYLKYSDACDARHSKPTVKR